MCAALADAAGLLSTGLLWIWLPAWRGATPWLWAACAGGGLALFLLRDASGGRARRWFALEVRDASGRAPGRAGSIRRNLPLLVPLWNLFEAWPVLVRGDAQRPADRSRGLTVGRRT